MVALGETITVINKSGKVVSSSKQIFNVFKEARSAYRERKAELQSARNAEYEGKKARRALRAMTINDDTQSKASSKRTHRTKSHRHRPALERGVTDSFYVNDEPSQGHPSVQDMDAESRPGEMRPGEITRRHTLGSIQAFSPTSSKSHSESNIDMDLAYGEIPPPLPTHRVEDEEELRYKMTRLQVLLDEANCVQHSVTAMIDGLQKNPDALAAVALTLAEVSNLLGKMAPGMLTALKGSFPAVMALLASPQFMIAAGVGVGVTIVALGGFKIVKKIRENKETEEPLQMQELQTTELSRIELWRRGIADVEASSVGTTVDGEFITPGASKALIDAGVLDPSEKKKSKPKSRAPKSTTTTSKSVRSSRSEKGDKKPKKKEPSGLKLLFSTH